VQAEEGTPLYEVFGIDNESIGGGVKVALAEELNGKEDKLEAILIQSGNKILTDLSFQI
jgi:hypothetical protein